jgi:hypothetical protein
MGADTRDADGLEAKRARDGVDLRTGGGAAPAAPGFVAEEITGNYTGEDLEQMRARRPTPDRFKKLEEAKDELGKRIGAVEIGVTEIRGDQRVQGVLLSELHDDMKARRSDDQDAKKQSRERVTKVLSGAIALFSSGAFIHWLVTK